MPNIFLEVEIHSQHFYFNWKKDKSQIPSAVCEKTRQFIRKLYFDKPFQENSFILTMQFYRELFIP